MEKKIKFKALHKINVSKEVEERKNKQEKNSDVKKQHIFIFTSHKSS